MTQQNSYRQTVHDALRMLEYDGGVIFSRDDLVPISKSIFRTIYINQPLDDAWDIFISMATDDEEREKTFLNIWPTSGVVRFVQGLSGDEYVAEEVNAETMWEVYSSLHRYKPWLSSVKTWILQIAKYTFWDFSKRQGKDKILVPLSDSVVEQESEMRIVHHSREFIEIAIVAERWMKSGDPRKFRFAQAIMDAYTNQSYWAPTGQKMADHVGVTRTTCFNWWKEFIGEIMNESKGR